MVEGKIIGLVRDRKFFPMDKKDSVNVSEMSMAAASDITPMKLDEYEGKVIMISGHDAGDWIYSAKVEDIASPILSAVTLKLFGKS
jgi:hypothetical protein